MFPSERLQDFVVLSAHHPLLGACFPYVALESCKQELHEEKMETQTCPATTTQSFFFLMTAPYCCLTALRCFPFGTCGVFTVFTLVCHLCLRHSPFFL